MKMAGNSQPLIGKTRESVGEVGRCLCLFASLVTWCGNYKGKRLILVHVPKTWHIPVVRLWQFTHSQKAWQRECGSPTGFLLFLVLLYPCCSAQDGPSTLTMAIFPSVSPSDTQMNAFRVSLLCDSNSRQISNEN